MENNSLLNEVNNLCQRQQRQQPLQEQHIAISETDIKVDENNKPLIGDGKNSLCEVKKDKVNNEVKVSTYVHCCY